MTKPEILTKINKVISSCTKESQLTMAKNYCYDLVIYFKDSLSNFDTLERSIQVMKFMDYVDYKIGCARLNIGGYDG
ncbi:MAG: hypothetical protein GY714_18150 [Desulfobacterales bacterium]|nr:hypothetical protein [Desulfobacterales bacterium]